MRHRLRTVVVATLLVLGVTAPSADAGVTAEAPDVELGGGPLPTFTCRLQSNYLAKWHGIYFSGSVSCDRAPSEIGIQSVLGQEIEVDGERHVVYVTRPVSNHAVGVKALSTPHGYCDMGPSYPECPRGTWYVVHSIFHIRAPGWNVIATSPEGTTNECYRPKGSSTYECHAYTWLSY